MKRPMRRLSDKVREAADAAWERGDKDLAGILHDQARQLEQARKKKNDETT